MQIGADKGLNICEYQRNLREKNPLINLSSNKEYTFLKSITGAYTYIDLDKFTSFFSAFLQQKQVQKDQPVSILADSCDESVFIIAACWKLGIPFVCFNPSSKKERLSEQMESLKPSVIFTDRDDLKSKHAKIIDIKSLSPKLWIKETPKMGQAKLKEQPASLPDEQIFGYFFTSGTTSQPKIVPLKRRQMIAAAKASARNIKSDKNDFWLLCLPLNHIGGVSVILRSLIYKSAVFHVDEFNSSISKIITDNKSVKVVSLVPTMLKRLLNNPDFQPHENLKILLGGGPVHKSLVKKCIQRNIQIINSYGMTETCAQIAAAPVNKISTCGVSVGRIFEPNEVQIRDEKGSPLKSNQSGMIWLKGPQVFDGYHKTNNRKYFDEDEWFNTGDFGRIDKGGNLFIESRRTDLIVTGGENVSPFEVEEALLSLNGVKEAAVIGLPDEEWGQIVAAAMVTEQYEQMPLDEIKKKLKTTLTSYKIPKKIVYVNALPRTASGKVKKKELNKLF